MSNTRYIQQSLALDLNGIMYYARKEIDKISSDRIEEQLNITQAELNLKKVLAEEYPDSEAAHNLAASLDKKIDQRLGEIHTFNDQRPSKGFSMSIPTRHGIG